MKKFNASKALRNDEKVYAPLVGVLTYIFYETIYKPILEIVNKELTPNWWETQATEVIKEREKQHLDNIQEEIKRNKEGIVPIAMVTNAKPLSALIKAILAGRVQYYNERFEGSFNADISKEIRRLGGKWEARYKRWYLPKEKLPYDVQLSIGNVSGKLKDVEKKIDAHLQNLQRLAEKDPQYSLKSYFGDVIDKLEDRFEEGIAGIIVAPKLTPKMRENLSELYTENMNLYIKGWTQESIMRLRKRIQKNAFQGYRASSFIKEIEHDFMMSHAKAKFIARQETSLLMSQFREERYKSVGVEKYRWSTSLDQRVRTMHKRLHGQIFTWDNPPIVDEKGHRAHPGQDFGCRCIAIPVID